MKVHAIGRLRSGCMVALALAAAPPAFAQFAGGVVGGSPPPTATSRRGAVVGAATAPATRPAAPMAYAATTWVPAPKTFPPMPPDPIERPEFRNKPVPIKKTVTSATAMMVIKSRDGSEIGLTSDAIATVAADSRAPGAKPQDPTFIQKQAAVGKEMQTSFDEAVRAVRVRYPLWEPGRIEFNFGEKYTPHDGGSAGTCFAVMLLSEIEGWEIDNKCAITGDISVNWKVRKIGGTSYKVRGATADKCLYAGVPDENAGEIVDMYLMYGFETVRDIQVFSLTTLQDATALLRTDRSPQLTEAMKEFTEVQAHAKTRATLATPDMQKALTQILALAPNHLSAKCLLDLGKGTGPKQVSVTAGLESIQATIVPYYAMVAAGSGAINRQNVPPAMTTEARKQLAVLRPVVPKELAKVFNDATQIVEVTESVAAKNMQLPALKTRWDTFIADWDALGMDKAFREKLMRE